ncbi:MAG: DUF4330 domain-containing protein [Defluviitaleaceae bacterium]|nr:DUF4330 domain-containing protein [Defluviitaleaceae bacterium]MCL2837337.1 DUF4330 domain-containing protein [Defluviitaleaceae bacterium]
MLDERGKLFGKLNIIDALVILLLVGLVAAVGYRFTASGMTRTADARVRYTLMIEGVRDFTLEYYQIGLRCHDERKHEYIGDIVGVRSEPFIIPLPLSDGTVVMSERPGLLRIFVDIEADARETASSILINGVYDLKVGSKVKLNTKFIDVEGVISAAEMIY